jgi:hypothetical protein
MNQEFASAFFHAEASNWYRKAAEQIDERQKRAGE